MGSERETQGSLSPKLDPTAGSEGQRGGSSRVESLGTEALLSLASHSRHSFDQVFKRKFQVPGFFGCSGERERE